ncbi:ATP-binding protein [Nonomuraea glycinis]|uniref:ATP-binding protein n=2 Tax=Nonomuraea glycinis TaxID=2047744 RepID=A0A918AIK0_9ACTN|nr:ATP-binding protein [Nonomuraea glycinis]
MPGCAPASYGMTCSVIPQPQGLFTSCLPLAAIPSAVPLARVYVRQALLHWEQASLIEDAELVASELITNAVKAVHPPAMPTSRHPLVSKIQICLIVAGDQAVIEVWDPSPALPVMPEGVDHLEEGGRGLFLIDHLAKSWGCRHPYSGGKTIWCRLR